MTSLNENDYEDLVADPFKAICDKALPQIYSEFGKEGFEGKSAFAKGMFTFYSVMEQL